MFSPSQNNKNDASKKKCDKRENGDSKCFGGKDNNLLTKIYFPVQYTASWDEQGRGIMHD